MRTLALFGLLALLGSPARALMPNEYRLDKAVVQSSGTVVLVLASSTTPTLVDTPQIEGSFAAEIQNRDASNAICCAFNSSFSTSTLVSRANSCRQIAAGGSWSVSRWWQNLRLWCQSLSTSSTSPVAVTQGY